MRENSVGDGNTTLPVGEVFGSAKGYVLSKQRGGEVSIFALVSATDNWIFYQSRRGNPGALQSSAGTVQQIACHACADNDKLRMCW